MAGAGGTEAQDWAQMLQRMYLRFFERRGFKYKIVEQEVGEVGGLVNHAFRTSGDWSRRRREGAGGGANSSAGFYLLGVRLVGSPMPWCRRDVCFVREG